MQENGIMLLFMVTPISQSDGRWRSVKLGRSNATMGRYGCTTSALCMALEKLRGYFCNPANAAIYWVYTWRGEIDWKATAFKGMKFIERGYNFNKTKIKKYANSENKAVVLCVNNGKHWLYVDLVATNGDIHFIDPINGQYYEKMPKEYKVTGYAIFEGEAQKAPEWMEEAFERAEKKGLREDDALTKVNINKFQKVLKEMGIIEKADTEPTIGWLCTVMERIKERY